MVYERLWGWSGLWIKYYSSQRIAPSGGLLEEIIYVASSHLIGSISHALNFLKITYSNQI
jgi:hypothetical protein